MRKAAVGDARRRLFPCPENTITPALIRGPAAFAKVEKRGRIPDQVRDARLYFDDPIAQARRFVLIVRHQQDRQLKPVAHILHRTRHFLAPRAV